MIRLAAPRHRDVPGETNASEHLARGVAVVIPPWNFPLAIPCGMTVAALVAGNTVVLKPSERSPMMAWHLARILREAGLPEGVLTLLTGFGDVGQALVDHPDVDLIAFTGSRQVGLEINRRAAETRPGQDHVKRVIAEMGGKNADHRRRRRRPRRGGRRRPPQRLQLLGPEVLGLLAGRSCSTGFTTPSSPDWPRPSTRCRSARPTTPTRPSAR